MAGVRKPREKLCASEFHPSKTRKTRTQSGRRSRPLLVPLLPVLEGWNALAHSFSRGFRTLAINSFRRQYQAATVSTKRPLTSSLESCCALGVQGRQDKVLALVPHGTRAYDLILGDVVLIICFFVVCFSKSRSKRPSRTMGTPLEHYF